MQYAEIDRRLGRAVSDVVREAKEHPSAVLSEMNPDSLRICFVLEEVLSHGLKDLHFFSDTTYWEFLRMVQDCLPSVSHVVNSVRVMASTDTGRARMFVRLALNKKSLSLYFESLLWAKGMVEDFYTPQSYLHHRTDSFLELIQPLSKLTFSFSLRPDPQIDDSDYFTLALHALRRTNSSGGARTVTPVLSSKSSNAMAAYPPQQSQQQQSQQQQSQQQQSQQQQPQQQSQQQSQPTFFFGSTTTPSEVKLKPETEKFDIHEKLTLLCQQDEQIETLKKQILGLTDQLVECGKEKEIAFESLEKLRNVEEEFKKKQSDWEIEMAEREREERKKERERERGREREDQRWEDKRREWEGKERRWNEEREGIEREREEKGRGESKLREKIKELEEFCEGLRGEKETAVLKSESLELKMEQEENKKKACVSEVEMAQQKWEKEKKELHQRISEFKEKYENERLKGIMLISQSKKEIEGEGGEERGGEGEGDGEGEGEGREALLKLVNEMKSEHKEEIAAFEKKKEEEKREEIREMKEKIEQENSLALMRAEKVNEKQSASLKEKENIILSLKKELEGKEREIEREKEKLREEKERVMLREREEKERIVQEIREERDRGIEQVRLKMQKEIEQLLERKKEEEKEREKEMRKESIVKELAEVKATSLKLQEERDKLEKKFQEERENLKEREREKWEQKERVIKEEREKEREVWREREERGESERERLERERERLSVVESEANSLRSTVAELEAFAQKLNQKSESLQEAVNIKLAGLQEHLIKTTQKISYLQTDIKMMQSEKEKGEETEDVAKRARRNSSKFSRVDVTNLEIRQEERRSEKAFAQSKANQINLPQLDEIIRGKPVTGYYKDNMGIWDTVKSGVLVKQSRVLKKWEPRWFVLQSSPPVLFYFKTASDNVPLGEIPLVGCTISRQDAQMKRPFCFGIFNISSNRFVGIAHAKQEEECQEWMESIKKVIANSEKKV